MASTEHLTAQARRAERLAQAAFDALTVERLQSFAADCRRRMAPDQPHAGSSSRSPSDDSRHREGEHAGDSQ